MPSTSKFSGLDKKSMHTFMIGGIIWLLFWFLIHSKDAPNCWVGNFDSESWLGPSAPLGLYLSTNFRSFLKDKKNVEIKTFTKSSPLFLCNFFLQPWLHLIFAQKLFLLVCFDVMAQKWQKRCYCSKPMINAKSKTVDIDNNQYHKT